MELIVIRHAIAQEREEFASSGQPDSERPLTDYGRRRMRRNARGLLRVAPRPDVLGSSPYARAAETAHILADTLGVTTIEVVEALTPEHRPDDLLPWLAKQGADSTVAIVGHDPHLTMLVTWLLAGRAQSNFVLKKGGACLLDLGAKPEAGTATLHWLLAPSHLRSLAD